MSDLKIYVEVDMEGISNVTKLQQVVPGFVEWEEARSYMTEDTNAAVRGIVRAAEEQGKKTVIDVADSHWKMDNILPENIDQRINKLIRGVENRRYPQVPEMDSSYDALICIGNHDHWNGPGVMSHTWLFWEWTVNGRVVTETDLNLYTAAEYNVPTIFVAGDDVITEKTKAFVEGRGSKIETVITKEARGWESAACYPFDKTLYDIEEGTYRAVIGLEKGIYKPIKCKGPVAMTIEFDSIDKVAKVLQEIENTEYAYETTTVKFTRDTYEEAVAVGGRILDMFYKDTLDPLEIKR